MMLTDQHDDKSFVDIDELNNFVSQKTGHHIDLIGTILSYLDEYINNKKEDEYGEVSIDNEELVAYILKQPDITLSEKEVEEILDAELEFLTMKGIAVSPEV